MTTFTSDASHKFRVPRLPTLLSDLATNVGVPTAHHLRFYNLLEQLTEVRKALYSHLSVYYTAYYKRYT